MQNKLVIIDYGMGNLRSVQKKFEKIGAQVTISSNPDEIARAGKLLLPGVGHFGNAVKKIKQLGIWDTLNKKVLDDKTPILGICLGMQLMAKHSQEGDEQGFGWFDAEVLRFNVNDKLKYKIPHTGWNSAISQKENPLMNNLDSNAEYYFVHAYHIKCNNPEDILATTVYDYEFTSAIQRGNIYGTQFHPEKSHNFGEKLLQNFLMIKK